MKENEYIICSAIWYKELPLIKPDVLLIRGFAPYNVDKGIVFCGWRHPNCMYQMIAITGLRSCKSEVGEYIQGFLTSKNRFVDRIEGAEIHVKNGGTLNYGNQLYSEDLY
ncbi:MAG: hypothetical protein ACOC2W_03265 [bacterium]